MALKVRMLQAEVREALLYICSTWTLLSREYGLLRTQHHRLLLRCVGFRKRQRSDHPLSYAATLAMTGCESVETTIRRRRLLFAGFLLRQQLHRLPRAFLRGSLVNGSNRHRRGRPEKSWWSCLTDDLKTFKISEGEWETLAKDRSGWCERLSQGAEVFMSAWRDNEREVASTRHARQAEKRASTLPTPP